MGKGALVILFALFIDGLQAGLDWAFLGMGAGITGATIGVAGPVALPLAIGIGMGVNICISATFGMALIVALKMFDMFDTTSVICGGLFEIIPGFDCLPGWTVMTVRCVLKAKAKEGSGVLSKVAAVASAQNPAQAIRAVAANDNKSNVGQEVYAKAA